MKVDSSPKYFHGEGFQFAATDCGRFEFGAYLPDEDRSLEWMERTLSADLIQETATKSRWAPTELVVPKFRIDRNIDLLPMLRSLGLDHSFSSFHAFAPLVTNPGGAVLSEAQQKIAFNIDEHGITAQAVTVMRGVVGGIPGGPPPPILILNRPFIFTVADHETQTILFMGTVLDPRGNQ